ncbi:MAG: hypothetical protein ACREBC_12450, partial [Pyrinomonadaceae bacterium]
SMYALSPVFTGWVFYLIHLGLTPQALCCRLQSKAQKRLALHFQIESAVEMIAFAFILFL